MSRVASNFKYLDKDKDKDLIAQMDKEHQKELKKVDYAIDLNTNKVKKNIHYVIYITDNENKDILHTDKALNKDLKDMYLINMETFNKGLDTYKDLDNYNVIMFDAKKHKKQLDKIKYEEQEQYILDNYTSKLDNIDALNVAIKQFNEFFDFHYLQGFSLKVKDLLDNDIKKKSIQNYTSSYTQVQVSDIEKIGIKEWLNSDLDTIQDFNFNLDKDILKDIQIKLNNFISNLGDDASDDTIIQKQLYDLIYDANLKRFTNEIDTYIDADKDYYKKVHKLYQEIDKKIINIVNWFKNKLNDLNSNYDITKFKSNNDVCSKLDPIAKTIFNGKNYAIDEIINTKNNYNDKSYSAWFSIKASDLSNMDIIEQLKAKGIKINHFDKKIIDDIDLLIDENKGNITNDANLVALTPKMIARKVYNKEQPTKKQQQEIEYRLNYLNNIYLFFVKDDKTADTIDKLKTLKDKGIEILQDKEGNILNIGDTLDDNIILNGKYGFSAKYHSIVYVFKNNKSIFYRVNQIINNEVQKQLITSVKDNANNIFNDYNKNVNNLVVGLRYALLERVNQIKHNIDTNKEMLLSNIYEEFDAKSVKDKANIRNIIKNILNYWEDINYISGYKFLDSKGNELKPKSTTEIYKIYIKA